MSDAYSTYADVCIRFYSVTAPPEPTADFIVRVLDVGPPAKILFIGGMFSVAGSLLSRGFDLVVADYSPQMIEAGRKLLPATRFDEADLAVLTYDGEFDAVVVPGRVFTHMLSDEALTSALSGARRALKPGGKFFADNYEDLRIQKTSYFNGTVECRDEKCFIRRTSTTVLLRQSPFIVRWDAHYQGELEGRVFSFHDSLEHRAFSRAEFAAAVTRCGLSVIRQGDNFDETSFYTAARGGE